MPHIVIRAAQNADAPSIAALLHELGYPSNTGEEVGDRLTWWSGRDYSALGYADRCGE
jgi:hypothetical protein